MGWRLDSGILWWRLVGEDGLESGGGLIRIDGRSRLVVRNWQKTSAVVF